MVVISSLLSRSSVISKPTLISTFATKFSTFPSPTTLIPPLSHLTLALLKPSLVANPADLASVLDLIASADLSVLRRRRLTLSAAAAAAFYADHSGKFFHDRLTTYVTSGPVEALVLAGPDAVPRWRRLMGPTKVSRAILTDPDSVRGRYGLTDTRNVAHGSDSEETAKREIEFFFPGFFEGVEVNQAAEEEANEY